MKHTVRPLTVVTLISIMLSITVWSSTVFDKPQESPVQAVSQNKRAKSLRDMALERDIEQESSSCAGEFGDLSSLSKSASTIVVGGILDATSSFSEDGHDIITKYSVDMERLTKAEAPISIPIEFVGFGGVVYINGHRVADKKRGFDKLIKGKRYVLFLEWVSKGNYYILSGGVSGIFSIDEHSQVHSLASDLKSELRKSYSSINLESFLHEVNLRK